MVGGFLEAKGQVRKIYDSVQAVFASFEAKYRTVALSAPNGWAKASLHEAVVSLQKLGASIRTESAKRDGLYTLQELELTAAGTRGRLNLNA